MKKFPLTTEDEIKRLERHKDESIEHLGLLVECQPWVDTYPDPYVRGFFQGILVGEIKNLKLSVMRFIDRIEALRKTL